MVTGSAYVVMKSDVDKGASAGGEKYARCFLPATYKLAKPGSHQMLQNLRRNSHINE